MNELDAATFPLSGHKVIEASAGTGKTYTITNLYLRLLLGESETHQRPLRVNEILVLTFTNAATDELRHRIRQRIIAARELFKQPGVNTSDPFLSELRNNSKHLATDAKILTAAIQLMDEAAIYTIHGFCARVLNEQPFETGTLFDQQQDADTNQLLRLASEDFFRSYIQTLTGSAIEVAIELWPNPEVLSKKIKPLIGRPDITLVPAFSNIEEKLNALEQEIEYVKQTWISEEIAPLLESCGINRTRKTYTRIAAMTEFCKGQSLVTDLWENFTVAMITKNLTKAGTYPDHAVFSQFTKISESLHLFEQIKTNLWHQAARWIDDRIIHFKEDLGSLTQDDLLSKVDQAISHADTASAKDPETGAAIQANLAQSLAKRWPVAMVDEFQDTDGAQYRIFSNIYVDQTSSSLFMIGDPKQAIYQFRGADIYTYINAKRQVNPARDLYSLGTNWRSSPQLIKAVNYLFDKPEVFSNDSDIPFIPVESPASKDDEALVLDGEIAAPIEIFTITKEGKTINKTDVLRTAMTYTALEVTRLQSSSETQAQLDIAILVRNRIEMSAAKSALAAVGVQSVYVTQDSVLNSSTAEDLSLFLLAVAEPGNVSAIRSALASRLCQSTAIEIERINKNLATYQQTLSEFQSYHDCWSKMGAATMIGRFIETRNLAQKWLGQDEGDRELTNLRHLAELLQEQSMTTPGIRSLIQWFNHERQAEGTTQQEDRQLRLDTDSELVKLVTMHASKGLEYDVVFIPTATIVARKPDADTPSLFHDESSDGVSFLTKAEVANTPAHTILSQAESQAENMRLLYVAITRAKKRCYLGIAPIAGSSKSPIATLLGLETTFESEAPYSALSELPEALFSIINATEVVQTFAAENNDAQTSKIKISRGTSATLIAPQATPAIRDSWRTHSYTGISRILSTRETHVSTDDQEALPGYQDDDQAGRSNTNDLAVNISKTTEFNQYHFPKGPKIGVALHDLLENLDFISAPDTWYPRLSKFIQRIGITENQDAWTDVLHEWILNVLSTQITPSLQSTSPEGTSPEDPAAFALSAINATNRLNELEFFFPLDSREEPINLLIQHGYLEQDNANIRLQLQGVMTGFVDLIVAHEGKFYVIDYKSNFLGFNQTSYRSEDISAHMASHHYHLQYLIYCVAVNRYLATRIPDYDYDQHFGGVHYLFLRGMQREIPDSGVFTHRPTKELITALDHSLINRLLQGKHSNQRGTESV